MPSSAAATVRAKSTLLRLLRGEQWPDQIDHRRAGPGALAWAGRDGFVAAHGA